MTGRAWGYAGVAVGGAISVYANVAEKFVDNPHPALDGVVLAGAAPVVLFLMSELLIAIKGRGVAAWAVRVAASVVAVVAFSTSFQHLYGLLIARGESGLTARSYPLGIDGLLVGATAVLWQIRTSTTIAVPGSAAGASGGGPAVAEPASPALGDGAPLRSVAARVERHEVTEAAEPGRFSDAELLAVAEAAIVAGRLPLHPSGNALRTELGIGAARAKRLAEQLAN